MWELECSQHPRDFLAIVDGQRQLFLELDEVLVLIRELSTSLDESYNQACIMAHSLRDAEHYRDEKALNQLVADKESNEGGEGRKRARTSGLPGMSTEGQAPKEAAPATEKASPHYPSTCSLSSCENCGPCIKPRDPNLGDISPHRMDDCDDSDCSECGGMGVGQIEDPHRQSRLGRLP
ncbi:MAG: hypothetical protein SGARI_002238 [Bacillariaceae sp.]